MAAAKASFVPVSDELLVVGSAVEAFAFPAHYRLKGEPFADSARHFFTFFIDDVRDVRRVGELDH